MRIILRGNNSVRRFRELLGWNKRGLRLKFRFWNRPPYNLSIIWPRFDANFFLHLRNPFNCHLFIDLSSLKPSFIMDSWYTLLSLLEHFRHCFRVDVVSQSPYAFWGRWHLWDHIRQLLTQNLVQTRQKFRHTTLLCPNSTLSHLLYLRTQRFILI